MAEVLLAAGAVSMAAYMYGRQNAIEEAKRAVREANVMGQDEYSKSRVPVVAAQDVLFSNSVRAKDLQLVDKVRGPEGSIKYIYYVPAMNIRVFSYAPLEAHTAK
jgi:hypothetical protein